MSGKRRARCQVVLGRMRLFHAISNGHRNMMWRNKFPTACGRLKAAKKPPPKPSAWHFVAFLSLLSIDVFKGWNHRISFNHFELPNDLMNAFQGEWSISRQERFGRIEIEHSATSPSIDGARLGNRSRRTRSSCTGTERGHVLSRTFTKCLERLQSILLLASYDVVQCVLFSLKLLKHLTCSNALRPQRLRLICFSKNLKDLSRKP